MPTTLKANDVGINLEIAAPPGWTFAAGDTIIGNVVRRQPIVAPEAIVRLALVGRVKTKITIKRGNNNRSVYRGRWDLLGETEQTIFRGPVHLPPESAESLTWPFEVPIPTSPAPSVLLGHCSEESFLPLNKESVAYQPLPGTFFSSRTGWNTVSEGFVEYYLQAELRYNRGGSWDIRNATCPITLRQPSQPPLLDNDLGYRHVPMSAKSQRLIPGMEDADLSFKQKTQKLFGSSKVPEFHFMLDVTFPRRVQFDNPSPIPFIIGIRPDEVRTTDSIQDVVQTIQLNWLRLKIKTNTVVLAPGNFDPTHPHTDSQPEDYHLGLERLFRRLEHPITFTTGKGNEPVNIGEMFQLVLRTDGLYTRGARLAPVPRIQPDFVTYNIRRSNALSWEISLTVAGEDLTFKGSSELEILGDRDLEQFQGSSS
ncbi:hypothetical protein P170DRAFT_423340 [Aspergillus steynii IBT 23096]|uniref:Arrestin-like N-terminal domain-containing protein n=1 Tax=Aspergillus steynii IBT 23096 TaxID=1392250 RepID=A0A2I2GHW2_9EURO|nr:uncharacterized protein P170DRAFT_423340 [Aspergillus steynii IBT 23096]PLB52468.1 hypothetical protein P170DRAFT_423340 [Aspergillus steynii IBT 23096]